MPERISLQERVRADTVLRRLLTLTDAPLHLVGGAVRDALRGATSGAGTDWDIAVPFGAIPLAGRLASAVGGTFVSLHDTHPTARVVFGATQYDFAEYRAPTLDADLRARDLTINAIAADLRALFAAAGDKHTSFVDPCDGLRDLDARVLRPCGPAVFAEDPVRILRLYRFVATLGFTSSGEAEAQVRVVVSREGGTWWWNAVSPERVTDELARLFVGAGAAAGIAGLARAGVLYAFVPHIAVTRGLVQGPNHHLDVFDHDLAAAMAVAEDFLPTLATWSAPYVDDLRQWLGVPVGGERTRRWLVPFASLLHDVGKAVTRVPRPNGKPDFPRHEVAGGHIAAQVAANLRLSRAERKLLVALVRYHGYPNALQKHGADHPLRFFAVAGEAAPGVILVSMGDRATARGGARTPAKVAHDVAFLQALMRDAFGEYLPLLETPPCVRGDDLIAALGLSPGKRIGELLLLLRRRQLDGTLSRREDALDSARALLHTRHPAPASEGKNA